MRLTRIALYCSLFAAILAPFAQSADSDIRMNTLGFLPDQVKEASIAVPCDRFSIHRADDDAMVFEGDIQNSVYNADTAETIALANFSELRDAGRYYLKAEGVGRSAEFAIDPALYNQPYYTVMRGMYLWRCGTAVSGEHDGHTYAHQACHVNDAYLDYVDGGHVLQDGTQGWHDAGDYNKYVVNAGVTVGTMLDAWFLFGPRISQIGLDLPESDNNIPDFLDEIRWEIDWLLKMQMDDGRVYHKVSTRAFGGFILPERETTPRYFTPWSSAATADFAAMTAMAARAFQPYDDAYAVRCLNAAKLSYNYLAEHPQNVNADLDGFSTGAYQTNDSDDRLWAAAELWRATGDDAYLQDFEQRARSINNKLDVDWGWGNVKNLAAYSYLLSDASGRDDAILNDVKNDLIRIAGQIVKTRDGHGYRRPFANYYWGCNGTVASQTVTLQIANLISPNDEYRQTALDAIGHLVGRNYYGRSFITGVGGNPPMNPHDRRSGGDTVREPWPGYLVGGGWPGAKDWLDRQESYQTNEIAINWNAPMIFALAGFIEPESSSLPGSLQKAMTR
ncbi:MAG: endoglucanase [bacterium]|nr:endoglucanase [bacterium]